MVTNKPTKKDCHLISSGVKVHGEESFLARVKCFSDVSKSFFILKISARRR